MILELSDLVAMGGLLAPAYIEGVLLLVRLVRLEQHCKDHTGFCNGD